MTGCLVSIPAMDQVPMDMKAQALVPSVTGIPVTAEAVSWVAGATTDMGLIPSSSHTCFWSPAIGLPGMMRFRRKESGIPSRARMALSQVFFL
ncbi:hypothetical protein SDC9_115684 [bioreactor metagenome]|uniref:Uncharacterized protein n=1 Tax=bioreactor metagenome TaxID=1076179 RepID=A0A645BTK2_9ZZZZ